MPLPVEFRLMAHNTSGLERAPSIIANNMRGILLSLGKRLKVSAQKRMRKDTGEAHEKLAIEVRGRGLNLKMSMYGTLVQQFVDAYGRKPGKFPPFKKGSRLYRWTERKYKGIDSESSLGRKTVQKISHLSRRPTRLKQSRIRRVQKGGSVSTKQRLTAREKSIEKMSFLMARHIYEHGIKASHWDKKTLDANKRLIMSELTNALSRSVSEINRGGGGGS